MSQPELIPLAEQEAWAEALRGVPHGYHHTWEYAHAMHLTTGDPTFLYVLDDPAGRIACPLVERRRGGHLDVATPSGLSGFVGIRSWSEFSGRWAEFAHERGYVN
jgi:hypothetical protein